MLELCDFMLELCAILFYTETV
jgi:hypothetical protein